MIHPPHQWTFRDLTTSRFAWTPTKAEGSAKDLPFSLEKLHFKHHYMMRAGIYLKPSLKPTMTLEEESKVLDDWPSNVGVLGCIKLLYASTELLTAEELNGTDTEEIPPIILYKVIVESRSLPATGKTQAVQAEELSMLSFGGSVDDDVKYGALASLYDKIANYVLEIYSVRGKKYKFDLMDATLSDGTVPRLPQSASQDAFAKSLCATVTDHSLATNDGSNNKKYAITRMNLTLEGKIRVPMDKLPPIDEMPNSIATHFRCLSPSPPIGTATANPSGHTLLLDPSYAGRIYVNGRYITTWGQDIRIGSHGVALFGMDLHSIPVWHGKIVDFEAMKRAYGQLLHEVLIDAQLLDLNIGKKLLYRLMYGKDPSSDDEDDEYDDDDLASSIADSPCLEAQILSSPEYDVVGIAPKALCTRFMSEFGRQAYPCRDNEVIWAKSMLPDKLPVVVPERLIPVLRRGGFFDVQTTHDNMWFQETRQLKEGEERELIRETISLLDKAGCEGDVSTDQIVVATLPPAMSGSTMVRTKSVCRYDEVSQLFSIHHGFISTSISELPADNKASLLALSIAQAHPNGTVLSTYILRRSATVTS
jgi:hypothetical protein